VWRISHHFSERQSHHEMNTFGSLASTVILENNSRTNQYNGIKLPICYCNGDQQKRGPQNFSLLV
jgi:hypothetical protein